MYKSLLVLVMIMLAAPGSAVETPLKALPLAKLLPQPGPIRLVDDSSATEIFIPLAPAAAIADAILSLHYTNSIALEAKRSSLLVRFNEATIAQIRLDSAQPTGDVDIRLPQDLWRPGYNKLTLVAIQHYTDTCEDDQAPELWTEIDTSRSHLSYSLKATDRSYQVADLSNLFAPGLGGQDEVLMLTAPAADADALRLRALPAIAQALALRRNYAPLTISHRRWRNDAESANYPPDDSKPGIAQILVGTPDQLASILPVSDQLVVDGPKTWVRPGRNGEFRLIISGRTADEVIEAARDLMVMDDALAAHDDVSFIAAHGPTRASFMQRRALQPGGTYDFTSLGVGDTSFTGVGARHLDVPLPLPADFYTYESAQAELSLDFAYGAGLGKASVVNILLNGEMVHGMMLNVPDGQSFHDYRIHLPARMLVPGINTLTFAITVRAPDASSACVQSKARQMLVQYFGNSHITMPSAGNAAVLPDLRRFAASGFPFVTSSDDKPAVVVADSEELLGPALTLIGKLAQQAHGPVHALSLAVGLPDRPLQGSAIILAPLDRLKPELFGDWAVTLGRVAAWPTKTFGDIKLMVQDRHLDLESLLPQSGQDQELPVETLRQRAYSGDLGILATYRNESAKDVASMMVITADSNLRLAQRVADLVHPELWGQLKGDLVTWKSLDSAMVTAEVGKPYEVGTSNRWLLLRLILSNNPWYWLGAVLAGLVIVSALSAYLLRQRRRRLMRGKE